MEMIFFSIVGIGICLFICGFAGRLIKTGDKAHDDEYKKSHQAFGSTLFELLKPIFALVVGAILSIIYIIISLSN